MAELRRDASAGVVLPDRYKIDRFLTTFVFAKRKLLPQVLSASESKAAKVKYSRLFNYDPRRGKRGAK
ncbi:MAG: hypothetical protein WAV02_01290 [Stellaceae bacterium]